MRGQVPARGVFAFFFAKPNRAVGTRVLFSSVRDKIIRDTHFRAIEGLRSHLGDSLVCKFDPALREGPRRVSSCLRSHESLRVT